MSVILQAEDDSQILQNFARRLRRLGHDLIPAEDGKRAWDLLCKMSLPPDFIVSDFDMPKMGGGQLLRWVRNQPRFRLIPFTLFTATKRDYDGKPMKDLCDEYRAHYVDKGTWDGDLEAFLRPLPD